VWRVQVRGTGWVLLWWPYGDEARIYYMGPRFLATTQIVASAAM
jgi:hypothetical protein